MKNLWMVGVCAAVLGFSSPVLADCHEDAALKEAKAEQLATPVNPGVPVKTAQLKVKGMMCGACAKKVRASLLEVPGVTAVTVETKKNLALVSYQGEVKNETLFEAVKKAGFNAEN